MRKPALATLFALCVILICSWGNTTAQTKYVDQDSRIDKYKHQIIKYLAGNYPYLKIGYSVSNSRDSVQISVSKKLELFSDSLNQHILLIRLGIYSSESDPYWGILAEEGCYFFYDADDLNELQLRAFMNKYDKESVETIIFYCNKFPTLALGGIALSVAKFNEKLNLVKRYLNKEDGVKWKDVNSSAAFLGKLSGIRSAHLPPQSLLNQPNLTKQDYTNWLDWIRKNSSRLYWDDKKHEVILNKSL